MRYTGRLPFNGYGLKNADLILDKKRPDEAGLLKLSKIRRLFLLGAEVARDKKMSYNAPNVYKKESFILP